MAKPLKIVFLGSGPIAIPVMQALAASGEIELQAVISQIDRPAGRKRTMTPTPLAAAALDMGIDVIRIPDVNNPEFVEQLTKLAPDMLCVVSFGQILKSPVLSVPGICPLNIHASLLPKYRGASPITQALLNKDPETGVCFMQMERGLDSGPVFRTVTMKLNGDEYADSLENTLGRLAADHTVETLKGIADGKFKPQPQDPASISVCRKISKRDGIIDWKMPASRIEAMSRAFFPWPGANTRCTACGKELNVSVCAAGIFETSDLLPGECADISGKLIVGCGDHSALEIMELIPAGGKRMSAAVFRNGLRGELPSFITEAEI